MEQFYISRSYENALNNKQKDNKETFKKIRFLLKNVLIRL